MKQEVIGMICRALEGHMPMLVLRGGDAQAREGGDIDILVPSWRPLAACQLIADAAKESGWYLCGFRNIGYVVSLTLCRPKNSGVDDAIKLDLISGLEWYGIEHPVAGLGDARPLFEPERLAVVVLAVEPAAVEQRLPVTDFVNERLAGGMIDGHLWEVLRDDRGQILGILAVRLAVGFESDRDRRGLRERHGGTGTADDGSARRQQSQRQAIAHSRSGVCLELDEFRVEGVTSGR